MSMSRIGVSLFGVALLCSASAFAGDTNNKGTLRLDDKVTVAGTALNPGDYKLEWSGNGPDVQVKVLKGRDTIATFPAHVTEQKVPTNTDAYGSNTSPDGSRTLTSVYFGGKHYVLQVEPTAAQQQNQQSNPTASK
jgi:hypothetical protein